MSKVPKIIKNQIKFQISRCQVSGVRRRKAQGSGHKANSTSAIPQSEMYSLKADS
jgi:hypothetical protein